MQLKIDGTTTKSVICLFGNHGPFVCMQGPRRHVGVLSADLPLFQVPVSLGQSVCQLQCTADWSAVYNCTFSSYSAARLLALLRCRCASVARRLLAEGWRWPNPRGIALPSCFCSIGVDHSFVCFFRQFWNRKSSCCPSWPAERLHEVSYVVAAGQFLWSSVASLPGTPQDHLYLLNA